VAFQPSLGFQRLISHRSVLSHADRIALPAETGTTSAANWHDHHTRAHDPRFILTRLSGKKVPFHRRT
jgi:hypothetical protein